MRIKDETGHVYGLLTVLYDSGEREAANQCVRWVCQCKCGNRHVVAGFNLRQGRTRSCGCMRRGLKVKL